jgi:putative transposase
MLARLTLMRQAVHPINGRMRDELLNEALFFDLDDARAKIDA